MVNDWKSEIISIQFAIFSWVKSKLEKQIELPLLKSIMGVFFFRMISAHVLNFCLYRE